MSVQYSRGCPFQCEFCDIIEIYGRVPRTKSNEQLLAELDELLRVGWRGMVFIVDDNFIGNKRNVKRLSLSWLTGLSDMVTRSPFLQKPASTSPRTMNCLRDAARSLPPRLSRY